jgi:hypothetical protein
MEQVRAGYLRQAFNKNDWLYEGYSCEIQVTTACQDVPESSEFIIYISKAVELVSHNRLLTKLSPSGVDSMVVVWVRKFLVGRTQRVRVGGQLSKEVKVTSVAPQGRILGPLLFLV